MKKNKSIVKIVLVLVGAFSLYGTITAISAYRSTLLNNYEIVERQAEVTTDSIDRNLTMIKGTMIALSGSDSVVKWRSDNDYFNVDTKEFFLRVESLGNEMQRALIYNNGWNLNLFDYVAIYEEDRLLTYTYTKQQSIKSIQENSAVICSRVIESDDYYNIFPPDENDKTMYTTLRIQSDFNGGKSLYIIGATSGQIFEDDLNKMTGYEGARVFLFDNKGSLFATTNNSDLDLLLNYKPISFTSGERKRINLEGINYSITKVDVNQDFCLVYMLPTREIMHQTVVNIRSLLALMLIMTFVMAAVVTVLESGYETRLLNEESEIKFLQHQMNPHFLFNILLTIQIKAKMSGDDEVSRMITSLSNLLRAGIYGDKRAKIKLEEELKYVEYYLSLQKERYDDKLTYQIRVSDKSLFECEVPRLSIEPIVENAVVHGLEEIEREGTVQVDVTSLGDDIVVCVRDNGNGFDPSILKEDKTDEEKPSREKVGLKNTDRRLKLLYGKSYGVTINSTIGEGTRVTIKIPKKKWGRND